MKRHHLNKPEPNQATECSLTVATNELPKFIHLAKGKIVTMTPINEPSANALTVDVLLCCTATELYTLGLNMGRVEYPNEGYR